jgi:hypothetical protein
MAGAHLPDSKLCTKCGIVKPRSDFQPRRDAKIGLRSHCRRCRKEAQNAACRKWYRTNAKYVAAQKRRHLMARYGITVDHYDAMLVSQRGLCAICRQPVGAKTFNVDHCHETGVVRGLLCHLCNRGLGLFRDNPNLLVEAIKYLADRGKAESE